MNEFPNHCGMTDSLGGGAWFIPFFLDCGLVSDAQEQDDGYRANERPVYFTGNPPTTFCHPPNSVRLTDFEWSGENKMRTGEHLRLLILFVRRLLFTPVRVLLLSSFFYHEFTELRVKVFVALFPVLLIFRKSISEALGRSLYCTPFIYYYLLLLLISSKYHQVRVNI